MSIHPSLNTSAKDKKVRSVLKRAERLKMMIEKDSWKEGQSIFALPKIKTARIKIKKEKTASAASAAPETGAAATTAKAAKDTPSKSATPKAKEGKK